MKSFYKRSAISLIVLGMAGSVYAAAPAPAPANNSAWAPQFSGVFLGAEGLDLRPMNGDLDYVTVFPSNLSAPNGTLSNDAISTAHEWGWRVYGGIRVTDNDDLTLSWAQIRTSDNDSVSPKGTLSNGSTPSIPRFLTENGWLSVNGHVTFDLDDAYAVWGHTINFNNPWSVRYAAGVEYARLRSDLRVTADSGSGLPTTGVVGFEADSRTRGVGPRVEFDMTYHLPYGFALSGNANGALLVGTRDLSLEAANPDQIASGSSPTDFSDRHVVIPKFGMRLGASYSYVWGQAGAEGSCRNTTLMVDAGWQAESYIHAIERPEGSTGGIIGLANNNAISSSFVTTKTSNFSDQGLFVGVQLGMDWM